MHLELGVFQKVELSKFIQKSNMYIAPNYNFLYTRKTTNNNSMLCSKKGNLNQQIHIGMMEVLDDLLATVDQTLNKIEPMKIRIQRFYKYQLRTKVMSVYLIKLTWKSTWLRAKLKIYL